MLRRIVALILTVKIALVVSFIHDETALSNSTEEHAHRELLTVSISTLNFGYVGGFSQFQVPVSATKMVVDMCGARGSIVNGWGYGYGARVLATVPVTGGTYMYAVVGGHGTDACVMNGGGYNGGGSIGRYDGYCYGGSGGGGTDIRLTTDINTRIIVAGGGGGGDYYDSKNGGHAGQVGNQGDNCFCNSWIIGYGGTQSGGGSGYGYGSLGQGGISGNDRGGAGGGGYYGGKSFFES